MHSFGYYFKKGSAITGFVYRKKSILEKVVLALYLITSWIGKLFFFLRPIFLIGDQNIAIMMNETHDIEINKIFEGINNKKRYSSLLISSLLIDSIVFGLFVLIEVPLAIIIAVVPSMYVYPMVGMITGFMLLVIVWIILMTKYDPMGFVATKGQDLTSGDLCYISSQATKGKKGIIFLHYLINYGIIYLVQATLITISVFLIITSTIYVIHIMVLVVVFIAFAYMILELTLFARLRVNCVNSLYSLYKDTIDTKHVTLAKKNSSTFDEYVALFTDDKEEF